MPDKAQVYENGNAAFVTKATLRAMVEDDYLASPKNGSSSAQSSKAAQAMRQEVIPQINSEINHGESFCRLRQVYSALILAVWFKDRFKESFYASYIDREKVQGIDLSDPGTKDKIYRLYVEAFQKGVYDLIKKESSGFGKVTSRHYHCGGVKMGMSIAPHPGAATLEVTHSAVAIKAPQAGQKLTAGIGSNGEDIGAQFGGDPVFMDRLISQARVFYRLTYRKLGRGKIRQRNVCA